MVFPSPTRRWIVCLGACLYALTSSGGCAWMRAKLHGWHEDEHVSEPHEYPVTQPYPQAPYPAQSYPPRQTSRGPSARDYGAKTAPADLIADPEFNTLLRKQVETLVAQRTAAEPTRTTPEPNAALGQEIAAAVSRYQSQTGRVPSPPMPSATTPVANPSPEVLSAINAMSDRLVRVELQMQSRSEPATYAQPTLPPITDDLQRRHNRQAAEQNKHNQDVLRKTYGTVPRPTTGRSPPVSTSSVGRDVAQAAHDESVSAAVDREILLLRQELALLQQTLDESPSARRAPRETPLNPPAAAAEPADELRQEMQRVLRRMAIDGLKGRTSPPVSPPAPAPAPPPKPAVSELPAIPPVDASSPLSLGTSLYRAGNYKAAEEAFRALDSARLSAENRGLVQYLIGACLRRQGKTVEALQTFERLTAVEGPVAEYARWQLHSLQWQQNLETQIQQLQQLRQAAVSATP